ncbi:MAG TPA: D-tyrosyl-tRNA(Tyr) deacylase [Aeromonadales bacterium]|nr:D-tyrosyl-tRNA(Tyr) deacylase [Aeromonadales bacterium]
MIALLQRVTQASVSVEKQQIASMGKGLLVLIGIQPDDNEQHISKILHKVVNYRIFEDKQERMNLSLLDIDGELILVPQFTLAADTRKGLRPGFSTAATPEKGEYLFGQLSASAQQLYPKVQTGKFGANMQVSLINDGPATFWLQV